MILKFFTAGCATNYIESRQAECLLVCTIACNLRRSSVKNVIKALALSVISFCCSVTAIADDAAGNDMTKYAIAIVSPEDGATFQNDTQNVKVTFTIKPELKLGDHVSVWVDGKMDTGTSPGAGNNNPSIMNINLSTLERGSHTVRVLIKNKDGKTIVGESSAITIHQQRPSKLLTPK